MSLGMQSTRCVIEHVDSVAEELFPARFEEKDLNPEVFSARRSPDRVHYRMVRCRACGLVRSDPVAPAEKLAGLYGESGFTYDEESGNIADTYLGYFRRAVCYTRGKGEFLEIGCGNGFFLERVLDEGFAAVWGVEPSSRAVDAASDRVRAGIVHGLYDDGLFGKERFDMIAFFQVLDHIPDPAVFLKAVHRHLKPGGIVLALNHDVGAWSFRLLGERSPIVDIEHTYLFDRRTMKRLFHQEGFSSLEEGRVWNAYSFSYLLRLLPLGGGLKRFMLKAARSSGVGRIRLRVPLGNLYFVGQKAAGGSRDE